MGCELCPRRCRADRENGETGLCGMGDKIVIARAAPHMWEEPPVSGTRGSGAVFFSGCPLGCVFCQNKRISRDCLGAEVSELKLGDIILSLRDSGVHNINLVTPTHFSDKLARVLRRLKPSLGIPVVYNCGGYERVEALRELEGLVDVYLPDFKYFSSGLAAAYSSAPDYPTVAAEALCEMYRQTGPAVFDGDGMITGGVIVRHLVLPGCRRDSQDVLRRIAQLVPVNDVRLSLLRQYTPEFAAGCGFPNLCRHLTSFEYDSVLEAAAALGFNGYRQRSGSDTGAYTPDFDNTDI